MTELLPCPFCGGEPMQHSHQKGNPSGWEFECDHWICCATEDCPAHVGMCETPAEAIAAWNRRAPVWQPISTAPKDGTEFQAWVLNGPGPGFWDPRARFDADGAFQLWGRVDYDEDGWDCHPGWTPTHWQPLPAPPQEPTE